MTGQSEEVTLLENLGAEFGESSAVWHFWCTPGFCGLSRPQTAALPLPIGASTPLGPARLSTPVEIGESQEVLEV